MTAYATGMRVSELCNLRGCDIDSSPDRMCIRVVAGEGGHDRYSLLTPELLEQLRLYWRQCRHHARPEDWLFPARETLIYPGQARWSPRAGPAMIEA
jgi:integrase